MDSVVRLTPKELSVRSIENKPPTLYERSPIVTIGCDVWTNLHNWLGPKELLCLYATGDPRIIHLISKAWKSFYPTISMKWLMERSVSWPLIIDSLNSIHTLDMVIDFGCGYGCDTEMANITTSDIVRLSLSCKSLTRLSFVQRNVSESWTDREDYFPYHKERWSGFSDLDLSELFPNLVSLKWHNNPILLSQKNVQSFKTLQMLEGHFDDDFSSSHFPRSLTSLEYGDLSETSDFSDYPPNLLKLHITGRHMKCDTSALPVTITDLIIPKIENLDDLLLRLPNLLHLSVELSTCETKLLRSSKIESLHITANQYFDKHIAESLPITLKQLSWSSYGRLDPILVSVEKSMLPPHIADELQEVFKLTDYYYFRVGDVNAE